ncbi:MAG: helix-turn-helix transcriptional regulator [Clostridia bacterium]|nr:helix-turn-helix transcriptional regulator [Clostridia bacterium]
MKLEELNPFIRYAKLHKFYNEQKALSVCYDCRLFFVDQGDGTVFANGQNYTVNNNTLLFFPPKTHYSFSFKNNNAVKIYVINFDLTAQFSNFSHSIGTANEFNFDKNKFVDVCLPSELESVTVKNNCLIASESVKSCVDLFISKAPYYKHVASAHLKLALINLLQQKDSESNDYKLVQSVQEYIRKHYNQPELSNETIAERFNYHPYHLSRLMKTHTKKTLHSYLIDFRIHMAKNYLTTTTYNVTTIAEKTGFPTYTYFIKIFREKTGVSPLQYRKSHSNIGF